MNPSVLCNCTGVWCKGDAVPRGTLSCQHESRSRSAEATNEEVCARHSCVRSDAAAYGRSQGYWRSIAASRDSRCLELPGHVPVQIAGGVCREDWGGTRRSRRITVVAGDHYRRRHVESTDGAPATGRGKSAQRNLRGIADHCQPITWAMTFFNQIVFLNSQISNLI